MGNRVRRIALMAVGGLALSGAAFVYAGKVKNDHAAAVATYEMLLPKLTGIWKACPHGPFLKEKFVCERTGSIISMGESHGDADYVVTPDTDEKALASIVVQAGETNGWKTISVSKPFAVQDAHFVYVQRTGGNHTYWTAVGVQGNSNYIVALTVTGTEKEREERLKNELPFFRQLVESSTFSRNPPPTVVASL